MSAAEFGAQAGEMRHLLREALWPAAHLGQLEIPAFADRQKIDGVDAQVRDLLMSSLAICMAICACHD